MHVLLKIVDQNNGQISWDLFRCSVFGLTLFRLMLVFDFGL